MIDGETLPTLDAPRVRLRWLDAGDVDALFDGLLRPRDDALLVDAGHEGSGRGGSAAGAHPRLFSARSPGFSGASRERRTAGCSVPARFFTSTPANMRAEVGYCLGSAYWQRGIHARGAHRTHRLFIRDAEASQARSRRRSEERELDAHPRQAGIPARGTAPRALERGRRDPGHGFPRPACAGVAGRYRPHERDQGRSVPARLRRRLPQAQPRVDRAAVQGRGAGSKGARRSRARNHRQGRHDLLRAGWRGCGRHRRADSHRGRALRAGEDGCRDDTPAPWHRRAAGRRLQEVGQGQGDRNDRPRDEQQARQTPFDSTNVLAFARVIDPQASEYARCDVHMELSISETEA